MKTDQDNKKVTDTYFEDKDIESLLRPRCGFKVSPDFKERVMAEARSLPEPRRHRWVKPVVSTAAAAAIISALIMTIIHLQSLDIAGDDTPATASVEFPTQPTHAPAPVDTIREKRSTILIADIPNTKKENIPSRTKPEPSGHPTPQHHDTEENAHEATGQTAAEGELPRIHRESTLDPDRVRHRLLETRRNEKIANLEHLREDFEHHKARMEKLMTDQNIN